MKILFIGDIVGRPGRTAVSALLPDLKAEYDLDFVIANGENLTSGRGFSAETIAAMQKAGVDFFTMGNHVFANKDAYPLLDDSSQPIVRPANLSRLAPGKGAKIIEVAGKRVLIINLISPRIMAGYVDSPFEVADAILAKEAGKFDLAIVDFHAEFTSEKAILAWHLDGRVSAVIGTHTHIPTADAKTLPKGTAFITDVGMVGLKWSSLGVDIEPLVKQALTGLPEKHQIGSGPVSFAAVLLELSTDGTTATQLLKEVAT